MDVQNCIFSEFKLDTLVAINSTNSTRCNICLNVYGFNGDKCKYATFANITAGVQIVISMTTKPPLLKKKLVDHLAQNMYIIFSTGTHGKVGHRGNACQSIILFILMGELDIVMSL